MVNIRRTVIESTSKRPDDGTPPPQKMSKLTITEPEEPQYEYHTTLKCYSCQEEIKNESEKVKKKGSLFWSTKAKMTFV